MGPGDSQAVVVVGGGGARRGGYLKEDGGCNMINTESSSIYSFPFQGSLLHGGNWNIPGKNLRRLVTATKLESDKCLYRTNRIQHT